MRTYGITPEQYDQLLENQQGRCAICRNLPKKMKLAVDHDHKGPAGPGSVRGLLCLGCNHRLLAAAYDSPFRLINAALYLMNPPAKSVLGEEPNERGDVA